MHRLEQRHAEPFVVGQADERVGGAIVRREHTVGHRSRHAHGSAEPERLDGLEQRALIANRRGASDERERRVGS